MNTKSSRETILTLLNNDIDSIMFQNQYKRRKNSNIYYKKNNIVLEKIIFSYHINPYYNPSALIRIYPYLELRFDEVNEEAKRIFSHNYDTIFHTDKVTIRQPIGFLVETKDWLIYNINDYSSVVECIQNSLNRIVIPFLDRCSTLEGFSNEFMTTDNISNIKQNVIYVIISMMFIDEKYKARELLEKYFNKKGLQNIYMPLYNAYYK